MPRNYQRKDRSVVSESRRRARKKVLDRMGEAGRKAMMATVWPESSRTKPRKHKNK